MKPEDVFFGFILCIIVVCIISLIVQINRHKDYKKSIQPGVYVYNLVKDLCNEFDEGLPLVGKIVNRSKNQAIIRYTDGSEELYDISMMHRYGFKVLDAKIYNKIRNHEEGNI